MLKLRNLAICATAAVVMAGCGGSDNSNSTLPSLYAGSWSGTWAGPEANDGGSLTWTVTSDGSLSGTMDRTGGVSGSTSGVISNTGQFTSTAGFATDGNFLIRGAVAIDNGDLVGSFSYSWLGKVYQGTLSLTNQSSTNTGSAAKVRK